MSQIQFDGNKLLHHLDKVNAWNEGKEITPIYLAFSPTSYCNHHCVFCVYHYKEFKPIFFPLPRYKQLVHEWSTLGIKSIFFAGDGDPLVNKNCAEMVKVTREAGIDIAVNTNGRLLNDTTIETFVNDLSFIRISLNAGSAENYAKIHGTSQHDFNAVLTNIKKLVNLKREKQSDIIIGVQTLLLKENVHEIKKISSVLKDIGVNYFSVKPYLKHPEIPYENKIDHLHEVLEDFLNYGKEISDDHFTFVLRKALFQNSTSRKYKQCLSTPFMIEIDALGDLYSCGPYIGNEDHKIGNIMNESFSQVWFSEKAIEKRKYVSCQVDVSKCMPFCRPDSVNEFLWQLKNPPAHVNYI